MLVSGVARTPAQKKRQSQKEIVRPRRKENTDAFKNILNTEMEKHQKKTECVNLNLKQIDRCNRCGKCGRVFDEFGNYKHNYIYYKCMECVEPNLEPKQICKKCSKCGRSFDDDGICENIPAYPGMH